MVPTGEATITGLGIGPEGKEVVSNCIGKSLTVAPFKAFCIDLSIAWWSRSSSLARAAMAFGSLEEVWDFFDFFARMEAEVPGSWASCMASLESLGCRVAILGTGKFAMSLKGQEGAHKMAAGREMPREAPSSSR